LNFVWEFYVAQNVPDVRMCDWSKGIPEVYKDEREGGACWNEHGLQLLRG